MTTGHKDSANIKESMAQGIHVVAKPMGTVCNMNCEYCFYLEKKALFGAGENFRMSDETLYAFVSDYMASQPTPVVEFVCQGAEPTLAGLHYLCEGHKKFFLHIRKYLSVITTLPENGLPASRVMEAMDAPLLIRMGQK